MHRGSDTVQVADRHRAVARGCRASLALLVPALAACYSYVPMSTSQGLVAGDAVRLRLTPAGTAQLAAQLGPRATLVEGRILRLHADSVVLRVTDVRADDGQQAPWLGELPLAVPASAVDHIGRRTLSRRRTILASVTGTVALVASGVIAIRSAGGSGGPGGGDPPPNP